MTLTLIYIRFSIQSTISSLISSFLMCICLSLYFSFFFLPTAYDTYMHKGKQRKKKKKKNDKRCPSTLTFDWLIYLKCGKEKLVANISVPSTVQLWHSSTSIYPANAYHRTHRVTEYDDDDDDDEETVTWDKSVCVQYQTEDMNLIKRKSISVKGIIYLILIRSN